MVRDQVSRSEDIGVEVALPVRNESRDRFRGNI